MDTAARQLIRSKVLGYLGDQQSPVRLSSIADEVRHHNGDLGHIRDSDVRNVVQSMIVTGKLNYTPGLKIELRKAPTEAH